MNRRPRTYSIIAKRAAAIAATLVIACMSASAQRGHKEQLREYIVKDTTLGIQERIEKYDKFYDSIKVRKYDSWLTGSLLKSLIVGRSSSDMIMTPDRMLERSQRYFGQFNGKTINNIEVVQADIFDKNENDSKSLGENIINSLHVLTSERQLRQNLLFKEGDKLDGYVMAINEQVIRGLGYLSNAYILVIENKDDPDSVSVYVYARDNWSVGANATIGSISHGTVYDRNFLGTGNLLSIKYLAKQKHQDHGVDATYKFNNVMGTFADIALSAGFGNTNNRLTLEVNRPFILPSDHIFGIKAGYQQQPEGMFTVDSILYAKRQEMAAWYGYSYNIDPDQGTAFYMTAGYEDIRHEKRPVVSPQLHPHYHDRKTLLLSTGLVRQNFFQGNMIYGYGRIEDVPYGFRLDATMGIDWNEFMGKRHYFSVNGRWADMFNFGYVNLDAGVSGFRKADDSQSQGMIKIDTRYFSPLIRSGKYYFRHFLNIYSSWGINRLEGDRERLTLTRDAAVRGMRIDNHAYGLNRFVVNSETVSFTPPNIYHFRFAAYVWGDIGWVGNHNNHFRNQHYSAIGIGVRIRNERLVFKSLSLRLGFAIKMPQHAHYNPFQAAAEQTLSLDSFTPGTPQIMSYN